MTDLADALSLLFLARTHVVRQAVDVVREAKASQLGRDALRIDDRVFLGEQDAVLADAQLIEHIHGFFAHWAAAHDQTLDRLQREGAQPGGARFVETA